MLLQFSLTPKPHFWSSSIKLFESSIYQQIKLTGKLEKKALGTSAGSTLADEDISTIEIDQYLKRIKESLRQKKFIEGQTARVMRKILRITILKLLFSESFETKVMRNFMRDSMNTLHYLWKKSNVFLPLFCHLLYSSLCQRI